VLGYQVEQKGGLKKSNKKAPLAQRLIQNLVASFFLKSNKFCTFFILTIFVAIKNKGEAIWTSVFFLGAQHSMTNLEIFEDLHW